jgi:hypothetical protein
MDEWWIGERRGEGRGEGGKERQRQKDSVRSIRLVDLRRDTRDGTSMFSLAVWRVIGEWDGPARRL